MGKSMVVKLTEYVDKGNLCYDSETVAEYLSSTGAIKEISKIKARLENIGHTVVNYDSVIVDETDGVTYSVQ